MNGYQMSRPIKRIPTTSQPRSPTEMILSTLTLFLPEPGFSNASPVPAAADRKAPARREENQPLM